ncbi:MAG: 3-isopropylmalate dehydrogenase [Microscillaceae bacterium]
MIENMTKYKIALLKGDGIGPEVVQAAHQVLEAVARKAGFSLSFEEALIGHAAIEAAQNPLPEKTLEICREADAILLGAVGHPQYDEDPRRTIRPEQGLLSLRKSLGLYANVRPIQVFEELRDASPLRPEVIAGTDIVFYRELTGGIYFGQPRERRDEGNTALDTMIYTRAEVSRIAHKAFAAALARQKRLCSVDKANVLESSRLWRETVNEIARQYPEVQVQHMYVDNAAMQLIKNPRFFDVVLTGNMFGDILTDEASQITGSLGMLPSASLGEGVGLFEPIHGSAPGIAGQGIANPMATILSAALLLELALQQSEAAQMVRQAVQTTLAAGFRSFDLAQAHTPTAMVLKTEAITQKIIDFLP